MRAALLVLLLVSPVLAGCLGADERVEPQDVAAVDDVLAPLKALKSHIVDPSRWSGEPSILALADGTLLITGAGGFTRYFEDPTDAPGNFGQSYVWRSVDDGDTWQFVDLALPGPVNGLLPYRSAIMGVEGDLAADDAGRVYFVDMTMLAGNGLAVSNDAGASWSAHQNPLVGLPATDRPWIAAMGDGEVYVKYLHMATGARVARSSDAGLTFIEDVAIGSCGQGAIVADAQRREMLVPCAVGDELGVMRTGEGAMNWERLAGPVAEGPANNVFVSMAVAGPGQYVFAWSERIDDSARVRVSTSLDAGTTWSHPVTVSTDSRTAVFPWVDANSDGVVGVVWYEADQTGASDTVDAEWHAMHARLYLAERGGLSTPAVGRLSEEPVHRGAICTSGLGCVLDGRSEDRRLLDFFEIAIDAAGRSHVTWTHTQTEVPTIWYGQVPRSG